MCIRECRQKRFKILNHRVFLQGFPIWKDWARPFSPRRIYDYTVWIDGSIQVKSADFVDRVISSISDGGWAMFRHPDRNCIYDEAHVAVQMKKYQNVPIMGQIAHYRDEGCPRNNGLFAAGIIARRTRAPRLSAINRAWWRENQRWTYQDQLSLPVVLWRLGAGCDAIESHLWYNDLFDWIPHRSDL